MPVPSSAGPVLRAWEDMRQPSPYMLVTPSWEMDVRSLVQRSNGGVGRAHALAVCYSVLEALSQLHAARLVHGRVSPRTVVRLASGSWSLVEYHTALPFGADFAVPHERDSDSDGYCPPERLHKQVIVSCCVVLCCVVLYRVVCTI